MEIVDLLLLLNYDDHILLQLEDHIKYLKTKYIKLFKDRLKLIYFHLLTYYCGIIKKPGA